MRSFQQSRGLRRVLNRLAPSSALTLIVIGASGASVPAGQTPAKVAALPAPPANGEMGFVLNAFAPAIYQGKDDCKDGMAGTIKDNYLKSLPSPERLRLLDKANEAELSKRWKASALGPDNTNVCTNPELFDRPTQPINTGKVAYGLNLDGDTSDGSKVAGGCAHANFTAPDGTQGIDNQQYRARGCTLDWRGIDGTAGDIVRGQNGWAADGQQTHVLLLRGVNSLRNDDNVEVIFATTRDRPVLDSQRNFVTNASFTVSDVPRWRNVLHGRIVNGVLLTDPADIKVSRRVGQGGIRGENLDWDMRRARFQLVFQPDGSLKGVFGGYQPLRNVIEMQVLGGIGAATVAGIDCAAELATLKKMADGMRDPKTGQCTTISGALDVSAVPAFVNDRPATPPRVAAL